MRTKASTIARRNLERTASLAPGRVAGFAYLLTIVAGMFAEVYARGSIWVSGDAVRTAANLRALEELYRWGVLADMVMLSAYVVVTVLLYRLFKPVNATLSLLAAGFSLLGLALLASATALLMLPLQPASAAFAYQSLRLHGAAYSLTGIFFGAYCLLIGLLILRSNYLPRLIGLLMALAGVVFWADAALNLIAPAVARTLPNGLMLVSLIGEGSLALWLAMFGMRLPAADAGGLEREARHAK